MSRTSRCSIDLLQTFITLLDNEGNASLARQVLGVNQPSMSKRLQQLQRCGPLLDRPWLERRGKTWRPTEEGKRVRSAVADIVDRYENLLSFVAGTSKAEPHIHFACGQQAVRGFVRRALRVFRARHPEVRLRISTLRGRARIEGVANGSLTLATVTHEASAISAIARRVLHIQPIKTERLALVCAQDTPWALAMQQLPRTKIPLKALGSFPLILPAPDAGIRKMLDKTLRAKSMLGQLDIAVETGGWQTILQYVSDALGVGVVSEGAIPQSSKYVVRYLDPAGCPPTVTKLICRPGTGPKNETDLSQEAQAWRKTLIEAAPQQEE